MGKVLVVYYFCVHLEEGWDIISMWHDTCWQLTPSSLCGFRSCHVPSHHGGNGTSSGTILLVGVLAQWQ